MTKSNIFETASRKKLLIQTDKGLLTISDLWDIQLHVLDKKAQSLRKQLRDNEIGLEESFLSTSKDESPLIEELQLMFDIIVHIIQVRLAEEQKLAAAKSKRDKQQQLLQLIHDKEQDSLREKTVEELRLELESLL